MVVLGLDPGIDPAILFLRLHSTPSIHSMKKDGRGETPGHDG